MDRLPELTEEERAALDSLGPDFIENLLAGKIKEKPITPAPVDIGACQTDDPNEEMIKREFGHNWDNSDWPGGLMKPAIVEINPNYKLGKPPVED